MREDRVLPTSRAPGERCQRCLRQRVGQAPSHPCVWRMARGTGDTRCLSGTFGDRSEPSPGEPWACGSAPTATNNKITPKTAPGKKTRVFLCHNSCRMERGRALCLVSGPDIPHVSAARRRERLHLGGDRVLGQQSPSRFLGRICPFRRCLDPKPAKARVNGDGSGSSTAPWHPAIQSFT